MTAKLRALVDREWQAQETELAERRTALDEPERSQFEDVLFASRENLMASGTWVELAAVVSRKNIATAEQLRRRLQLQGVEIAAMTVGQAEIAHAAYWRFGIGSGHPAKLNFGDCFSYTLAVATGEPVLIKGDDFAQTDVQRAI